MFDSNSNDGRKRNSTKRAVGRGKHVASCRHVGGPRAAQKMKKHAAAAEDCGKVCSAPILKASCVETNIVVL
jgi:hypothetical protein